MVWEVYEEAGGDDQQAKVWLILMSFIHPAFQPNQATLTLPNFLSLYLGFSFFSIHTP